MVMVIRGEVGKGVRPLLMVKVGWMLLVLLVSCIDRADGGVDNNI